MKRLHTKITAIITAFALILPLLLIPAVSAAGEDGPTEVSVFTLQALRSAVDGATGDMIITLDGKIDINSSDGPVTLDGGEHDITILRGKLITYSLFTVNPGATLTLRNIVIDGNKGVVNGNSLVRVDGGTLNMHDGAFLQNNIASVVGGGVNLNSGTFTMTGGTIRGNTSRTGAGVYILNGTFTMTGGTISGNTATSSSGDSFGGGVHLNDVSTFNMTGGTISGNTAGTRGGGVTSHGALKIGGSATIKGNTVNEMPNNVYLYDTRYITLGTGAGGDIAAPSIGMSVGVTKTDNNGVFVESGALAEHVGYFSADNTDKVVALVDGAKLGLIEGPKTYNVSDFSGLQTVVAAYALSTVDITINVTDNITMSEELSITAPSTPGATLTIKSDADSIKTITRGEGVTGTLITVKRDASLIIENITIDGNKDNVPDTKGRLLYVNYGTLVLQNGAVLQNNSSSDGRGVYIDSGTLTMNDGAVLHNSGAVSLNYGTFNMTGGTISGNTIVNHGGGVIVYESTFNMTGGTISGNTTTNRGGGVYVYTNGTFNMTGGTISGNTANYGGGVYVYYDSFYMTGGTFNMTGGTISGNTADYGGGVYMLGGTVKLGGAAVIKENKKGSAQNNVYLCNGKYITLGTGTGGDIAAPADDMEVWVQTETAGGVFVESGAMAKHVGYFFADDDKKEIILTDDKTLAASDIFMTIEVSDFSGLQTAIAAYASATKSIIINVTTNITMTSKLTIPAPTTTPGVTLTIKSGAGSIKTITRGEGATGNLFTVNSGASLIMENITIEGNKNNITDAGGSLIYVNGGTFAMNDGAVLQNNNCSGGGGVYLYSGTFNMGGGTISGNTTTNNGGGVYANNGTFNMTGGTISGNTANSGGGVYIYTNGTFNMTGGTISGNTANPGGGGGGVSANGAFKLGGTAVIKGNSLWEGQSNVYLSGNRFITLGTGNVAPKTGMEVWVSTEQNNGVFVNNGASAEHAQYFFSDDSTVGVKHLGSQLRFLPFIPGTVAVTGTVEYGQELTATPSVTSTTPGDLSCQWLRDGVAIEGANGYTYTLAVEDTGTIITAAVSAANYGGYLESEGVVIGKATLTPSIGLTGVTGKVYDGTVDIIGTQPTITFNDAVSGDFPTATAVFAFGNAGVGNNKTIVATNITLDEAFANCYVLSVDELSIVANGVNITQKDVIDSINFIDGKATYSRAGLSYETATYNNSGDNITYSYAVAAVTPNTAKLVNDMPYTVGEYTVTATYNDGNNYGSKTVNFTVERKPITVDVTVNNKAYDGTVVATIKSAELVDVIAGDKVTLTNGMPTFTNSGVGEGITVTFTDFIITGDDAGNYTLTQPTNIKANITKRTVSGNITFADGAATYARAELEHTAATYGGSDNNFTYTYAVSAETPNAKLSQDGKPYTVGNYTVTATYDDGNNYGSATATFTVKPKPISVDVTVAEKPYDGTGYATISKAELDGVISGDDVELNPVTATFTSLNAGENIPINFTDFSISGADAFNYTLTQPKGVTANITKATTGLTATAPETITILSGDLSKKYFDLDNIVVHKDDYGTRSYALGDLDDDTNILSGVSLNGTILVYQGTGETTGTATQSVTIITSNYENITVNITFTITNKTNISGNIIFADGTAEYARAELEYTAAAYNDSGANFTYTYAVSAETPNAKLSQDGKPYTVGNYTVTATYDDGNNYGSATATFTVKPKPISVDVTVAEKPYDGTGYATISKAELDGVISGDDVELNPVTATFTSLNAGENIPINFTDFSISGVDAFNYTLTQQPDDVKANITKASGLTAAAVNIRVNSDDLQKGTFDLNSIELSEDDYGIRSYTLGTLSNNTGVLSAISLDGNILTYQGDGRSEGTATQPVTIITGNYADITVNITFTVTAVTSEPIYGDVNGKNGVEHSDVTVLKQWLAGWKNLGFVETNADVNDDGKINDIDVIILKRYLAGWKDITLGK